MDSEILKIIIGAVVTISGLYFAYLKVVVPEREKAKAASSEQKISKLIAERDMWKEKVHAVEAEILLEREKRQNIEMRYNIDMNEYKNALDSIELFNTDENVAKVVKLLKEKLKVNISPART